MHGHQWSPPTTTHAPASDGHGHGRNDDVLVEHSYDAETPASAAVIQAVCALENADPAEVPTDIGFVLYEHVDPDALDTVLAAGNGDVVVVEFELEGYSVRIEDTGRITVSDSDGGEG